MDILVTGGTGTLGRTLVDRLRADGTRPRVLSRTPGPGRMLGDLSTGVGVDDAVAGTDVVVHCATAPRHDTETTSRLIAAAHRQGSPHLIFVSIVGVDRVPLGYYREKLAAEGLVASSGLPWTILRATQFHDLLVRMFVPLARTGVLPVLAETFFQPVDTRDVAARLIGLAAGPPVGRVDDLGGPQVRPMAELARAWLRSTGRNRRVVPVRMPGAAARGFRDGGHLVPGRRTGTITFEEFLGGHTAAAGR